MATITYPVCRTVNDAGTILTGCTVTVASVLDLDGTPVASHGAQVHVAGSLVSVTYDAAAKGDAWITLSVSKSGETITNENASPAIFASADPSRITYLDAAVSSRSTYAGGAVASVTAPVTVGTNNDKTGYKLASDGLDSISTTAPSGVASNFREMMVQVWRRFFRKTTKTSSQIKTYADDGTTVTTTQAISNDGTTQTQGAAS